MHKYRITLEGETCGGDQACCEEAPNTFGLNEDGRATVLDPTGDPPERILSAAKLCRLGNITLHDIDTGAQVYPPKPKPRETTPLSRFADVVRWRTLDVPILLGDGTEVRIRSMTDDDADASYAFFCGLPDEDRKYLRVDVTRPEVVRRRISYMKSGKVKRLVATAGKEIVADGALELSGDEWASHVAELRLIVSRPYQRRGLGMLMARELYGLAAGEKVEEIVVRMAKPQTAARNIFRKLGFREEAVPPDQVRDRDAAPQDVIQMRCDLESLWNALENYVADSDWQRAR